MQILLQNKGKKLNKKTSGRSVFIMKETLKRIKADVILSAILCVALGVILMIWPTLVTKVLCYILAAILCVMGI